MTVSATFKGLRGSNDFTVDGQRPKSFRELVLRIEPNGKAPLAALTSLMPHKKVSDPEYSWYAEKHPDQQATVANDNILHTAGTTEVKGSSGANLIQAGLAKDGIAWVVLSSADHTTIADQAAALAALSAFRIGHIVQVTSSTNRRATITGIVETVPAVVGSNSANFRIKVLKAYTQAEVRALSWDTGGVGDVVMIVGNANEEGAERPSAIAWDPVKYSNLTQIFRTPLEITRTAKLTYLRTGDEYNRLKKNILMSHMREMEKAFLFGEKYEGVGANGKPIRTTQGLIPFVLEHLPQNVVDFSNDDTYPVVGGATPWAGMTWENGGLLFLDVMFEKMFRVGGESRLCYLGSEALLAINQLVRDQSSSTYNIGASTQAYGMNVLEIITPFGRVFFKTHPLMTETNSDRKRMIIFEAGSLRYNYITDTYYKSDDLNKSGSNSADAIKEEYLTEAGLAYDAPDTIFVLDSIGVDNA